MTTSSVMPLAEYIQDRSKLIESRLAELFPTEWTIPDVLKQAMLYSITAGGKRMRPILTVAAVESLGGDIRKALSPACAIELVHTYSLIHDDLPAMDNDDFRRGKPTNHRVFGEAMAMLAGDGLLTHAFHIATEAAIRDGVSAERTVRIVRELAEYAGPRGMVGGQAADMLGEQGTTTLSELDYIHLHKTSDLIIVSLRTGAHCANADEQQLAALEHYGRCIGLAFQIQDDVLDVIGDEQALGKKTQSDMNANKVTYPYLLGVEACLHKVAALTEEAKSALQDGKIHDPLRLLQLADYLMSRDR